MSKRISKKAVLHAKYGHLFNNFQGNTIDLIVARARGREGTILTMRALTPASNPNTAEQKAQRSKFSRATTYASALARILSQTDVIDKDSGLVRYHACMSLLLDAQDNAGNITLPKTWLPNALHFPDTVSYYQPPGSNNVDLSFSTELGSNGSPLDRWWWFALPGDLDQVPVNGFRNYLGIEGIRETGGGTVENMFPGDLSHTWFLLYFSKDYQHRFDQPYSSIHFKQGI